MRRSPFRLIMADSSSVSVAENLEYTTTWNSIALQSKARTLPIDIVMACPDYIAGWGRMCRYVQDKKVAAIRVDSQSTSKALNNFVVCKHTRDSLPGASDSVCHVSKSRK